MLCLRFKNDDRIRLTLPDGRIVMMEFGENRRLAIKAPDDVKIVRLPRGVNTDERGVIRSIG